MARGMAEPQCGRAHAMTPKNFAKDLQACGLLIEHMHSTYRILSSIPSAIRKREECTPSE